MDADETLSNARHKLGRKRNPGSPPSGSALADPGGALPA